MADWRKIRPVERATWLQSLPEEIYDLSDTSHMVRLIDAMCGESGVGAARKSLFLKRMQTSLSETVGRDLDTVYSQLFNLRRLKSEEYPYDLGSLLTFEQRQEVSSKDAHYRGRIYKYMLSFQYGGTRTGIKLAAEAALGEECQVIEGWRYYKSMGVDNLEDTTQSIGRSDRSDYNEYTVVVMRDEPLTDEERRSIYDTTRRIRPVDSVIHVECRGDLMRELVFTENPDEVFDVVPVETSSDWWSVRKYVTGRPDWDYEKYPSEWVEPNVPKEAPRQFLVNSQEEQSDFTFMAQNVRASSEHIGMYGAFHSSLFEPLRGDDATSLMEARNAISAASSRKYTASFYGGGYAVDWSYPTEYIPELNSYFLEEARSSRFWSSNERMPGGGPEWIEFDLKRLVPINRIKMNISRKPFRIVPYLSSAKDENGNRIWVRVSNKSGLNLSYTSRSWGGSSLAGDMNSVEFEFVSARADAVRIEFERIDVPYYRTLSDGAYEEERFPYSIEVSDLSVYYEMRSADDYIASSYEDPFGNRVDTSLNIMGKDGLVDGDPATYWLSQPNIGEDAVEYIILDVRRGGKPVRMNFIDLSSIYGGCQMNVYSTEDDEPGSWRPYPFVYELRSGRTELPTRKVSFLKLEFTSLCAIPYTVAMDGIEVVTRQFPWEEKNFAESHWSTSHQLSGEQRLLASPEDSLAEVPNVYSEIGIRDIYQSYEIEAKKGVSSSIERYLGFLFSGDAYRSTEQSQIKNVYGDDMAIEEALSDNLVDAVSVEEKRVFYRFHEEGRHVYDVRTYERSMDLAYVVGIQSVSAGYSCRIFSADPDASFSLPMSDGRFLSEVNGWSLVSDERMKVESDSELASIETVDLQTLTQFKTFEFAVNQNPPREIFEHPSDMAGEWHGLDSEVSSVDFGVSGTVLRADLATEGKTGIESESKLVRSKAIAEAQVKVFAPYDGEWIFECRDLYGENVFSMKYDVERGKWTTLGVVFMPQPGGSWWNSDYSYRVRVPLMGRVSKGMHVFIPNIDFDDLARAGICADDFNDVRLVFFNGIECEELDCDVTDNMELWFRVQQDLGPDVYADGRYHFDEGVFVGAYYFYFGNKLEKRKPLRDYHKVFDCRNYSRNAEQESDGTIFSDESDFVDIEADYRISSEEGFLSLEFTPDGGLVSVPEGEIGTADVRFLIDYEDEEMRLQLYTYEKQLMFVIIESDGFKNGFVSEFDQSDPILSDSVKSHILVQWGRRGSAPVYKDGEIDPNNRSKRKIEMFVDSADGTKCINNVYDSAVYDLGIY